MSNFKRYILAICIMLIASVVSLFVVSILTFLLKWQADKAMIGIIVTYVVAGFVGGFYLRRRIKRGVGGKVIAAVGISMLYMLLLMLCSIIGFQIPYEFSSRFLSIWLLVAASSFGAMCLK